MQTNKTGTVIHLTLLLSLWSGPVHVYGVETGMNSSPYFNFS